MTIAIDIDDTICTTMKSVIKYINERIPEVNLTLDDLTSYWVEDALPEEYKWIAPLAFERPEMWKEVELIEGAAQYIEKLYNDGHEIYFATATTPLNFKKKIGFLKRNLTFFPEGYIDSHMISIKRKQLLAVDFLVDDCINHFIGANCNFAICMDYSWNRNIDFKSRNFIRVHSWEEIYKKIIDSSKLIDFTKKYFKDFTKNNFEEFIPQEEDKENEI